MSIFSRKKEEESPEIKELKLNHQDQINKMNTYFSLENKEKLERNNIHWQHKLKSQAMNFEEVFKTIRNNLKSPEAKKICIKKFNQIIVEEELNNKNNNFCDNLAARQ